MARIPWNLHQSGGPQKVYCRCKPLLDGMAVKDAVQQAGVHLLLRLKLLLSLGKPGLAFRHMTVAVSWLQVAPQPFKFFSDLI